MRDGCKDGWMDGWKFKQHEVQYILAKPNSHSSHSLKTNSTVCKTMQVHRIHFIQRVTEGGGGSLHKQIL
jgi:hypothetical protein